MIANAETTLNAVIGYPLAHSMSPRLHAHSYAAHGINAVMLAFPHPDVRALVSAIRTLRIGLTAVTIPHKETIIPHLDALDESSRRVGAVNTVIREADTLRGYNTDVHGVATALSGVSLQGKAALVIGAGGAARAVAFVLSQVRARIYFWSRTPERVRTLADQFGGTVLSHSDAYARAFDIIINATPVGMPPEVDVSPLPDYPFRPDQVVMDCVYNPLETRLLKDAATCGARVIPGLAMFVAQGIEQIRLWSGISVDVQPWREILIKELRPL